MDAVEERFRSKVTTFLTGKGLLPREGTRMLKG